MIKTAVIMAAGKGTRFGSRTSTMPKGFIPFKGIPMIERSIECLLKAGIEKIIIGTGYHKEWYEELAAKFPGIIQTVFSPMYADSNSMETLYQCQKAIADDDFLLLESDLVFEPKAISSLLEDKHPNIMLVSEVMKFQDQYYIMDDDGNNLIGCSTDKDLLVGKFSKDPYGELVGIHKLSNKFYREMVKDYESQRDSKLKRGYEFELEDIATRPSADFDEPNQLYLLKPADLQWYEIDDGADLKFAEENIDIS